LLFDILGRHSSIYKKIHMAKNKTDPIDMYDIGPIYDRDGDGYEQLDRNFESLLSTLFETKDIQKRTKILFGVSVVIENNDKPYRSVIERIRTFSYLCRLYERTYKKPFDLEEVNLKRERRMESYRKEGERRTAWGMYSNYVRESNRQESVREFTESIQNLPYEEQHKKIEEFKQGNSPILYIS
jgi:hypothetical protein